MVIVAKIITTRTTPLLSSRAIVSLTTLLATFRIAISYIASSYIASLASSYITRLVIISHL